MQSSLLVSQFEPRAIAIKPVQAGHKKPGYVLTFEKLDSPAGKNNITCTARFSPADTFDETTFSPLLQTPIYGCLGLVQVENGKNITFLLLNVSRAFYLRYYGLLGYWRP